MVLVYDDGIYTISHTADGYLVQNTSMDGFCHTHIKNLGTAMHIIDLSKKKKCPFSLPRYLLISLHRINGDERYRQRIQDVLNVKKKDRYVNRSMH